MKLSVVVASRNEGGEVLATVNSLRETVKESDLEIVVVDDASTDNSCDGLSTVRHEKPMGVAAARNAGYFASSGDLIGFVDAHMRFPEGSIDHLVKAALETGGIVCAKSSKLGGRPGTGYGCDLYWGRKGVVPKWKGEHGVGLVRVACPMGACYVMTREAARKLTAPTGRLWDGIFAHWGFNEAGLALKAYLTGVPIYVDNEADSLHLFRKTNPCPEAMGAEPRNMLGVCSTYFREKALMRLLPFLLRKSSTVNEVMALRPSIERSWTIEREEEMFTHLFGGGATGEAVHREHSWLADIEKLEEVKEAWIWRPCEAAVVLRKKFPAARITVVEWNKSRIDDWRPTFSQYKVDIVRTALTDDGYVKVRGNPDLFLVGGDRQEDCLAVVGERRHLVNALAGKKLVDKDDRTEEEDQVKVVLKKDKVQLPMRKEPPLVTVVLLSWKRLENIPIILNSLAGQSLPLEIWCWNNGEPVEDSRIARSFSTSENCGCWGRWMAASLVSTPFVAVMDDDLCLKDDDFLKDAVNACMGRAPHSIVGLWGWSAVDGKDYRNSLHQKAVPDEDRQADVVKGRFMLLPTHLLRGVPLKPPLPEEVLFRTDDIAVSLLLAKGKRGAHLLPRELAGRYVSLPAPHALNAQAVHYSCRDKAISLLMQEVPL